MSLRPSRSHRPRQMDRSTPRIMVGLLITMILCSILYYFVMLPNIIDIYSFGLGVGFILLGIVILIIVMYISIKIKVSFS
ncbi:hypothetical protein LCGC14_1706440 [marine sediment metagenome]|uniref:Uncharacterized protein n=1 Tax=marine sediment metagenome TaxID=412755 RepID=A0A0F9I432_9ZZZZ